MLYVLTHATQKFKIKTSWCRFHITWLRGYHVFLCLFNSSPPSAAYMCQWIGSALVQIMACCLFDNQNTKLFIHENASENIVCEMAAILSRGRWVNSLWPSDTIWRQRSGSTLASSQYLNQCWLIISEVNLFGANLLSEPILTYLQSHPKGQTAMEKMLKLTNFRCWNCT